MASPSFMMVIPTQQEVTLHYGSTPSNIVGQVLTAIGWVVVVTLLALPVVRWARRRYGPGGTAGPPGADSGS